jgi:hypothetical protein
MTAERASAVAMRHSSRPRKPCPMREQVADGHLILEAPENPAGSADRRVELDGPDRTDHDGGGGSDHLGQRREVVDALLDTNTAPAGPVERPEPLRAQSIPFAHDDRCARIAARVDAALHHALDRRELAADMPKAEAPARESSEVRSPTAKQCSEEAPCRLPAKRSDCGKLPSHL